MRLQALVTARKKLVFQSLRFPATPIGSLRFLCARSLGGRQLAHVLVLDTVDDAPAVEARGEAEHGGELLHVDREQRRLRTSVRAIDDEHPASRLRGGQG